MAFWQEFETVLTTKIIDATVAGTTYIGYAEPGNLNNTSKKVWMIIRVVDDGAGTTTTSFAQNKRGFISVWDDRATYNYG